MNDKEIKMQYILNEQEELTEISKEKWYSVYPLRLDFRTAQPYYVFPYLLCFKRCCVYYLRTYYFIFWKYRKTTFYRP